MRTHRGWGRTAAAGLLLAAVGCGGDGDTAVLEEVEEDAPDEAEEDAGVEEEQEEAAVDEDLEEEPADTDEDTAPGADEDAEDTADDPRETGAVVEGLLSNAGEPDMFPCPVAELADGQRFHLILPGFQVEDDLVVEDALSFEYDLSDGLLSLQVRLAGEDVTAPATGEVLVREGDPLVFTTLDATELRDFPPRAYCGEPDEELLFIEVARP